MVSKTTKEILIILGTVLAFAFGSYLVVDIEFMDSFGNFANVFAGLDWFIGLFIAASLFTGYLVVVAKINFLLRFLAIPLWLVFTVATLVTIDQFLGYAYPSVPPKAQVMAYRMYLDPDTRIKMIEAWMRDKKDGRTRLYKFEWTDEREEKLKQGEESDGEGIKIEVELKEGSVKDIPFGKPQGEHLKHGIKHRGLPPKEEHGP